MKKTAPTSDSFETMDSKASSRAEKAVALALVAALGAVACSDSNTHVPPTVPGIESTLPDTNGGETTTAERENIIPDSVEYDAAWIKSFYTMAESNPYALDDVGVISPRFLVLSADVYAGFADEHHIKPGEAFTAESILDDVIRYLQVASETGDGRILWGVYGGVSSPSYEHALNAVQDNDVASGIDFFASYKGGELEIRDHNELIVAITKEISDAETRTILFHYVEGRFVLLP